MPRSRTPGTSWSVYHAHAPFAEASIEVVAFLTGTNPSAATRKGVGCCEDLNATKQAFRAANPDAVAFALETGRVSVVGQDSLQLGTGEVGLLFGDVKLSELDTRTRVAVVFEDLFPGAKGRVDIAERRERFRVGHQGVAVIVARVFGTDLLQEQSGLIGLFLAQQTLAQMRAGIDVRGVAFERCAIAGFSFVEFAFLKINIAQREVMMWFVEMMDLRLQFLDTTSIVHAGKFETGGHRRRGAIDGKEIIHRAKQRKDEDPNCPTVFLAANSFDQHPDLKRQRNRKPGLRPDCVHVESQISQEAHECCGF